MVSDDASFPRGDGFYFNSLKLLTLVVAYLCWVATCRWVEQDATDLDLPVTNKRDRDTKMRDAASEIRGAIDRIDDPNLAAEITARFFPEK